jgi:ABC-type antimicrobial peptide transport system ATPase subunit
MVAMARALMARPKLLIMDEPSMGLSPLYVDKVFEIIQAINREDIIPRELKGQAYFIDTLFDPRQSIRRSVAGGNMEHLAKKEPAALHAALSAVAENLIAYSRKAVEIGAAGIFMSVPAAGEIVGPDLFRTFVKPYAQKVFAAVSGPGRMNVAHIHGEDLYMDECLDFPDTGVSPEVVAAVVAAAREK